MDFDLEILKNILISFHQMEYLLENTNISSIKEISKKISEDIGINSKKSLNSLVSPYKESKNLVEKESRNTLSNIQVGGVFFHDETWQDISRERETLTRDVRDAIYSKYTRCIKKLNEIEVHLTTKESRSWYKSWLFAFLEGANLHNMIIIAILLFMNWNFVISQEIIWEEPEVTTWCFEFFLQLNNGSGDPYFLNKDGYKSRSQLIKSYSDGIHSGILEEEILDWDKFIKSDFLNNAVSIKKSAVKARVVLMFCMLTLPTMWLLMFPTGFEMPGHPHTINVFHNILKLSDNITKNNYNLLKKYELSREYNTITYELSNTEAEFKVVRKLIAFVNKKHKEWSKITKEPILLPEIKEQILDFVKKPETIDDLVSKEAIKYIGKFVEIHRVGLKATRKVVKNNTRIFRSRLTVSGGEWYNGLDFETKFVIIERIIGVLPNNWERVLEDVGINIPRDALIPLSQVEMGEVSSDDEVSSDEDADSNAADDGSEIGGSNKTSYVFKKLNKLMPKKTKSKKTKSKKSSKKKTTNRLSMSQGAKRRLTLKKSKKSKKSIKPKSVIIHTKKSNRFDGSQNLDKDKITAGIFLPNF